MYLQKEIRIKTFRKKIFFVGILKISVKKSVNRIRIQIR